MTQAYPLHWPAGRPRTSTPARSLFKVSSLDKATGELLREVKRLGGSMVVISTNVRLRNDGLPYSNDRPPSDKGVAVYFTHKGKQMCFACDRWDSVKDNVYAAAKTIEALRGIERWGTGEMVQQSFSGFMMLEGPRKREWWEVLGIQSTASYADIKHAYWVKRKATHPDAGGNAEEFQAVQDAFDTATKQGKGEMDGYSTRTY